MVISYKIESITLNGNDKVNFPENGIVLIVGPNNSGKSTILREINDLVRNGKARSEKTRKVLREIIFEKKGEDSDLSEFLKQKTNTHFDSNGSAVHKALQVNITSTDATTHWARNQGFHGMSELFCHLVNTEDRLTVVKPPSPINTLEDVPTHPIHVLYSDDSVENKLCTYFRDGFDQDLIVNIRGGSVIPIHIGEKPKLETGENRASTSYAKKLSSLPQAQEQGDGIKSFLGSLLSTLVIDHLITLLDEPEAFLHPPQASLLSQILAKEYKNRQLLISTHSIDILKGFLISGANSLTVLRITRKKDINSAHILNSDNLKKFWSNPVLKFSNILDGLFHEGVILCESDGDCRFYSAMFNYLCEQDSSKKFPDLFFTSAGGISGMEPIINALRSVKMPTHVIADFDLLAKKDECKKIFEALGGDWEKVRTYYEQIKVFIDKHTTQMNVTSLIQNLKDIIEKIEREDKLSRYSKEEIKQAIKTASAWGKAKTEGINFFTASSLEAVKHIMSEFSKCGLFIVPLGEMESFDKNIKLHGTKWVAKALQKSLETNFENAKDFMAQVIEFS